MISETRQQVTEMVKKILDKDGRPNPFKDNRPGKDWWYSFLSRNKLAWRSPSALEAYRASACTKESWRSGIRSLSSLSFVMAYKINQAVSGSVMKADFLCVPSQGKFWHRLDLRWFILLVLHKNRKSLLLSLSLLAGRSFLPCIFFRDSGSPIIPLKEESKVLISSVPIMGGSRQNYFMVELKNIFLFMLDVRDPFYCWSMATVLI